jgi:hypothetical protein
MFPWSTPGSSLILNVQAGSGAHPASYPMGTGDYFPGGDGRDVKLTSHRWGSQPYALAALYPQEESWYSFLLEARRIRSTEKNKTNSSLIGIKPATFRLVAQCLNQLRYRVPQKTYIFNKKNLKQCFFFYFILDVTDRKNF